MNTKSINALNMIQTSQTCLETNRPLFKDVPSLVRASAEVEAIVIGILAAQRQQASKEGLVDEKLAVRIDLAEAAHETASLAHACATEHGYNAIAKRTDLSLSGVSAGTEAEFLDRCKGILADADELTDELGDCGMTPAKRKNLKEMIDEFEEVKPKPQAGVAVSKNATKRVPVLIRRATKILSRRVDRLMVQFKKTQPDFYGAYKAARKIVNLAATRETAKSKAKAAARKAATGTPDKAASSAPDKSKVA